MHDDMQAMRVYQLDQCLKDGQIPCRWVPDMGYQYGYPQFNYYGPTPYYIMEGFHLLGVGFLDSVKIGFVLALLLGNLAMFFLGKTLWGNWGGLLSAVLYAYAPYRAGDVFSRGAMGETWGFVFMPLILLTIVKLVRKPTIKASALLSLSLAGLFTTHNITSFIFLPLATLWTLGMLFKRQSNKKEIIQIIKKGILGLVWGIAVAGFFILPVIFEKRFAHIESMLSGYFNYLAHFATAKQLFFTTFWTYGSSVIGPHDDFSFFIGPLHLLLVGISLFTILFFLIKKIKISRFRFSLIEFLRPRSIFLFSVLALALSIFMTHFKSAFVWKNIDILKYLQFPWRFLSPATFFVSLAGGFLLVNISPKIKQYLFWGIVPVLIIFNAAFFYPRSWIRVTDLEKFSGYSWDTQLTISIFDYLPIFAELPPNVAAPRLPIVSKGTAGFTDFVKKTNQITFTSHATASASIQLNQFDFPGWKVRINGQTVEHHHQNKLGLITFDLPPGENNVSVKLTNTPIRFLGNILTLIFLPFAIFTLFKKTKNES